jgi:hypothetical protein
MVDEAAMWVGKWRRMRLEPKVSPLSLSLSEYWKFADDEGIQ